MKEMTSNKRKVKKVALGFVGIVLALVVLTVFSVQNRIATTKIENSQWVCIAKECEEWLEGDEWITSFCRPQNDTLMCIVQIDGQTLQTPLSNINMSSVRSCGEYRCVSEVLVRVSEDIKK